MHEKSRPYRLRPRKADDLSPLADLWVKSWQAVMAQIDFLARRDWLLDHIAALESEGGRVICAIDTTDRLAGFVLVVPPRAYLDQIAVDPRDFGRGAASCLLDEAKRLCPGGLTLDVNNDNPRALAFYEREGFVRTAKSRNPRSGLATWTMAWPGASTNVIEISPPADD